MISRPSLHHSLLYHQQKTELIGFCKVKDIPKQLFEVA